MQEVHSATVIWTAFMHPVIEDAEKEALERTDRVNKAVDDFRNFYIVNKIYFSPSFCKVIDSVFQQYWDKAGEYNYKQQKIKRVSITVSEYDLIIGLFGTDKFAITADAACNRGAPMWLPRFASLCDTRDFVRIPKEG